GDVAEGDVARHCRQYEEAIAKAGGIDFQILGIGRSGHIGFNEPGSSLSSRTRIKTITRGARTANARWFGNDVNKVPRTGLTLGVGTIMEAEEVVMVISGFSKARALQRILENEVNHMWTVSMMQLHQHGMIVCDDDATMELKVATVKYFRDIEKENMALPEF
ncbi:MAG TPA: 6-phosphogluconolactonase, partial [Bacteroidota bacterium]|nr:6-phosphogluconolactonase [Bacteroidota bacterium]